MLSTKEVSPHKIAPLAPYARSEPVLSFLSNQAPQEVGHPPIRYGGVPKPANEKIPVRFCLPLRLLE
jgi:hypothetical protein